MEKRNVGLTVVLAKVFKFVTVLGLYYKIWKL